MKFSKAYWNPKSKTTKLCQKSTYKQNVDSNRVFISPSMERSANTIGNPFWSKRPRNPQTTAVYLHKQQLIYGNCCPADGRCNNQLIADGYDARSSLIQCSGGAIFSQSGAWTAHYLGNALASARELADTKPIPLMAQGCFPTNVLGVLFTQIKPAKTMTGGNLFHLTYCFLAHRKYKSCKSGLFIFSTLTKRIFRY